jgi:hypothetical protein
MGSVGTVADVAETASSAAPDVLGHTLKLVVALLTTAENTSLGLELVHGHGGKGSGLMVSSGVVVNLVDRNSGVDNIGLDNLPVHNRLDSLVDVLQDC